MLEANPKLSWRDVQHIIVRTARRANLRGEDWTVNGAGHNISHAFGFGLMDAGAMVRAAQVWETAPEQMRCEAEWEGGEVTIITIIIIKTITIIITLIMMIIKVTIGGRDQANLSLNASCGGLVGVVEHVHVSVDISSNTRRGLFSIELQSPSGTVSQLLAPRPLDNSLSGEYLYLS